MTEHSTPSGQAKPQCYFVERDNGRIEGNTRQVGREGAKHRGRKRERERARSTESERQSERERDRERKRQNIETKTEKEHTIHIGAACIYIH